MMIQPGNQLSSVLGLNNGDGSFGGVSLANASTVDNNGTDESPDDFKKSIIYELLLAHDQGTRSFHIGLGSVALALAAIMIGRILYDAWRCSQLQVQLRPTKFTQFQWLKAIHPAEAFPLILFTALIIQQLVFVPVQSTALNSVTVLGCTKTTQVVYPAIFIIVYLHVVFGLEMTFRSFSKTTFHPRRKWSTAICLILVALMLLATWIPTAIFKTRERCVGSLVWWPLRYNILSISILGTAFVSFKVMAVIIGVRLRRTMNVDPNERIAASRMVFYLNGASVLNAFIIPFFIQAQLHKFDSKLTSSILAELVFFGQGILLAALHMVMRANAGRLVIKPKDAPWQKRRRFRLFGPNDLEVLNISGPIGLIPRENDSVENLPRLPEIEKGQYGDNDDPSVWSPDRKSPAPFPTSKYFDQNAGRPGNRRAASPPRINTSMSPTKVASGEETNSGKLPLASSHPLLDAPKWPLPLFPIETDDVPKTADPVSNTTPTKGHKRTKSNYSLFPAEESSKPSTDLPRPTQTQPEPMKSEPAETLQLPATVYTPPTKKTAKASKPRAPVVTDVDDVAFDLFPLAPPPVAWDQRHRRGASTESSATVQIGLRLSTAPGGGSNRGPMSPTKRAMPEPQSPVRPSLVEEDIASSLGLPRQAFKGQDQGSQSPMKQSQDKAETARAATENVQSPRQPVTDKSLPPTPRVSKYIPSRSSPESHSSTPPPRGSPRRSSDYGASFDSRSNSRSPGPGFF